MRFSMLIRNVSTITHAMRYRLPYPLLIVMVGLLAYSNSWHGPFIFDDHPAITHNPAIRRLWPPSAALSPPARTSVAGRPLVNLSLAINYQISELDPWSYHAFNLAVHLLNGWLLYGICRHARQRHGVALAIAVVWLVHPLLTETVTYTIQRTELLAAFCLLAMLQCLARGRLVLAALACAAGMACKEIMAVAPVLALLYDRTFLAGSFREAWRVRNRFYLALASTWLILFGLLLQQPRGDSVRLDDPDLTPAHYLLTQASVITKTEV